MIMSDNPSSFRKHFVGDISAGLVVFLIAVPLCLGISLASGTSPFTGIIAGVVGGIVVGFISGSSINVSGPAASVALVIAAGIQTLGSYEAVLVAVVLAGIFQIILGFIKAGTIAYFFPNAMIKGILASIGIILILKQIPHAFGVDQVYEGIDSFWNNDGSNTFSELAYVAGHINWGAVIITLVSLFILILWDQKALKKYKFFQYFPGALTAVIVGVLINQFFFDNVDFLFLNQEHLVELPIAESFEAFAGFFSLPNFNFGEMQYVEVVTLALSICFIASLESLLSTEAGDKLDPYKRRTSTNRELKAQGIGNVVSGLIGGLPITAVIVRTSANVDSGGRTKTATITHGLIMLICVALIPGILNLIPLACLAAVLFVVGYKLTSITVIKSVFKQGNKQFFPFIITIIATLFSDLITGIMIGGTVAVFYILRDNYKNAYLHDKVIKEGEKKTIIKLSEETTFLNKVDIMLFLDKLPENHEVVIDGSNARFVHPDIIEIIQEFRDNAEYKSIKVSTIGLEDQSIQRRFWAE